MKNHLLERRIQLNKTQEMVFKEAGISRTAYYYYENGIRLPDIISAMNIAKALNTSVDQLWGLQK